MYLQRAHRLPVEVRISDVGLIHFVGYESVPGLRAYCMGTFVTLLFDRFTSKCSAIEKL